MKVIYYSFRSTFAALMAACFHTGIYKPDKLPGKEIVEAHYALCTRMSECFGELIYVGIDESYREVYCTGCKTHGDLLKRTLNNMNDIFGIDEELYFINTNKFDGFITRCVVYLYKAVVSRKISKFLFNLWFKRVYLNCASFINSKINKENRRRYV